MTGVAFVRRDWKLFQNAAYLNCVVDVCTVFKVGRKIMRADNWSPLTLGRIVVNVEWALKCEDYSTEIDTTVADPICFAPTQKDVSKAVEHTLRCRNRTGTLLAQQLR